MSRHAAFMLLAALGAAALAGAAWLWLRFGAAVFLGGGTALC